MTEMAPARGNARALAAAYLRQLLLKQGSYRRLWEQHVVRDRRGEINQLAVSEVLARHLWNYPRHQGDGEIMPRQLKDSVSRGLSGRLLSRGLLTLFIDAFTISDGDAERLWRLYEGSGSIAVLSGRRAVPVQVEQDLRAALGPPRHRTLSLHDHAELGADGRLARTRTMQVIEATEPDTRHIPYLYDTSALTLEVGLGCQGISRQPYLVGDVLVTNIILSRALEAGETATLEYWTTYAYPGDMLNPSERQYRRAVMNHLENFDIRVQFHSDKLPATLWWASWDGVDGDVLSQEQIDLDSQNSAHRYLRAIERTVVGYHWSWP
jgi:hypothetical protein